MASVIDIIVWLFAAVGLITLTGIALYYIAKSLKKYTPPSEPLWPTDRHMEKLGAQCPTGWVYRGQARNGDNICQNMYNVPVANNKCYDDSQNKTKNFRHIKDWEKCQNDPGNCRAFTERCKWIRKCGPPAKSIDPNQCNTQGSWSSVNTSNPYASWIGVANKC